jgi:HK97 gp10 family phage protein
VGIEANLDGMGELIQKIEGMGKKMAAIESDALNAAAEPVLDDAKTTSSFVDRTGNLRKSLKIGKIKGSEGNRYVLVGIDKADNSNVFYGKFIEFGSSHQTAKPFLSPALNQNKQRIQEIIRQKIKEAIGK